jgi:hypothetical protein
MSRNDASLPGMTPICSVSIRTVVATQIASGLERRFIASARAAPKGTNITMLFVTSSPPNSPHVMHQKPAVD